MERLSFRVSAKIFFAEPLSLFMFLFFIEILQSKMLSASK